MALGKRAPHAGGRSRWSAGTAAALVLAIIVVFAVNLMPLQIVVSFDAGVSELIEGLGLRVEDSISVSLVQRLIVYVPFGLLAYAAIALRGGPAPFLLTILIVAVVGLSIELLQGFLSKRHSLSIDFLFVLIVGVLTASAAEIAANLVARRRAALIQVLLLGNFIALSAIWLAHQGSDLESWNCSYPLIIGNEATSDRPWLGKIRGLAIYARALEDEEVEGLSAGFGAAGSVDRRTLGAELIQSFEGESELEIARPALIEATHDASGLCEAIKSAAAFTIEIELASLDLDQRGPARILSMSLDPEKRNVTLGQDGGRLSLRIRNTLNGDNGIEQQIRTADGVISGDWQHWVARYDQGVTALFLDGDILNPSLDYESILLISGRQSLPLALICGLISLLLGAAAYGWLAGRPGAASRPRLAALGLALAPQAAMALTIAATSHRLPAASVMLTIAAAAVAGVFCGERLARSTGWFDAGEDIAVRPRGPLAKR